VLAPRGENGILHAKLWRMYDNLRGAGQSVVADHRVDAERTGEKPSSGEKLGGAPLAAP
jgi:hypothetical protein